MLKIRKDFYEFIKLPIQEQRRILAEESYAAEQKRKAKMKRLFKHKKVQDLFFDLLVEGLAGSYREDVLIRAFDDTVSRLRLKYTRGEK